MKVSVGQLSLLELESPAAADVPVAQAPARHNTTRHDKPSENVAAEPPRRASSNPTRRASGEVALLTTDETASRLRVHPRTVQRLVERGQLCVVHLGSAVRFDPQDVDALIAGVKERRRTPPADAVRVRRSAVDSSFADRLRSQRHEHRAAQA